MSEHPKLGVLRAEPIDDDDDDGETTAGAVAIPGAARRQQSRSTQPEPAFRLSPPEEGAAGSASTTPPGTISSPSSHNLKSIRSPNLLSVAIADIKLFATSPGGTVGGADVPSPTRPAAKFLTSPLSNNANGGTGGGTGAGTANRSLSTPVFDLNSNLGSVAATADGQSTAVTMSSPSLLDPNSAYLVSRAASFPAPNGPSELLDSSPQGWSRPTTTTVPVDALGKPRVPTTASGPPVGGRPRSLSTPSPIYFPRHRSNEPISAWKLQPPRPITSMCPGPKPGLVFVGSKDSVVLLNSADGTVVKELNIDAKYLVKESQSAGGVSPYLAPTSPPGSPSSPTTPGSPDGFGNNESRHRHTLEITEKDFIANMHWIEDTEGLFTGSLDRARRASFASVSDRSPASVAETRGRHDEVEPMLLDGGVAIAGRTSMDADHDTIMASADGPRTTKPPQPKSGLSAALAARRRSSPHSIKSVDTIGSGSGSGSGGNNTDGGTTTNNRGSSVVVEKPIELTFSSPKRSNSRSSSPASTSESSLPSGWLVAHFSLNRPVQWDLSRPNRVRRIYPTCGCIYIQPKSHFMWGACTDHFFRQWDLRTGACVKEIDSKAAGQIPKSITVSSKFLFTTLGDTIERWNLESGAREVVVRIKPPEPVDDDPLRRQRRMQPSQRNKIPPVFTESIALPHDLSNETDLYGRSARHGIYAWDFRSDPRGAYMRWPVLVEFGNETVHWMSIPPVSSSSNSRGSNRRKLWVLGDRTEHKGTEIYVEEHDPIRREKLRSFRLHVKPMCMTIQAGEDARMYVGTSEGMVVVFDVCEEEAGKNVVRVPAAGGEGTQGRRVVREVRDIYG